jgi:hypothetical protein
MELLKSKINSSRYVPSALKETFCNEQAQLEAFWDKQSCIAMVFSGKSKNHILYCRYKSEQRMTEAISELWYKLEQRYFDKVDKKSKAKEAAKVFDIQAHYPVGTILVNSWGWEQTNIEFYKVLSCKGMTLEVREVYLETVKDSDYSHGMADMVVATDELAENTKPLKLRIKVDYNGTPSICNPESFYYFSKWDGSPRYRSWYY